MGRLLSPNKGGQHANVQFAKHSHSNANRILHQYIDLSLNKSWSIIVTNNVETHTMSKKVKPPLFTLRGHNEGVTALTHSVISGVPHLISGDELGTVVIWNLLIYRISVKHLQLVSSRIQSLKVIKLNFNSNRTDVLVIQSRDNGVELLDLNHSLQHPSEPPIIRASFPAVESIFSRGDAMNIDESDRAILAYPSYLEKYLVTIRIIDNDSETRLSGTASRNCDESGRNFTVFDIVLREGSPGSYLLFVAYEDGHLCIFSFNTELTTTVPVLNSVGLQVEMIKSINLNIGDFISAYDIVFNKEGEITAFCGSPLDKIIIISTTTEPESDSKSSDIKLKRQGISAITIRPDRKLFAVACWDNVVRLYSMKTFVHLANIKHHSKQVQNVLFIERPDNDLCTGDSSQLNQDKTTTEGKYLLCCASMEGTISISALY